MTTVGNCTYVQARYVPVAQEKMQAGKNSANAKGGKGLQP
jgi:hypothetical protein